MPEEFAKRPVAGALREIDIADLAGVEPRDLILRPAQVAADAQAAGRALVYARTTDQASYDAIGFRLFAAAPRRGPAPLQTSAWTEIQRRLTDRQKSDTTIDEILTQQVQLRHRPLALPNEGEDYRYEMGLDTITLYRRTIDPAGREAEDRWTFSLTDPPAPLLTGLIDLDEPLVAAQRLKVELEATHWLPFPVLLAEGRFRRLQDVRASLIRGTRPGAFYCFLSHRWLDPAHPDPDALQARFAAWQLVAYLAEAVRVADQRGLHQARRFSPRLGTAVGPRGTGLGESLIVNVLRPALDAAALRTAAGEVLSLEAMLEDFGVAKATGDAGLDELRSLLAERPTLRGLAERIYIWYDFSCLPQPPREGDDAELFIKGLRELVAAQVIGRTAIMLDDAEDYLSRAWCTLEALTAGSLGGATDLLVGSARPSTAEGEVERHFETLVEDRPHVVWRAVLDTEVFRVQTPMACMRRLGLDVTDPNDLPFIYERLRGRAAPAAIHIDDSEIVTGVLPLPAFENGRIMLRARRTGRAITAEAGAAPTATLDWTGALSLADTRRGPDVAETLIAPLWHPDDAGADQAVADKAGAADAGADDAPACHVAVIGACEGEAILLASWVRSHRAELESLLSVAVTGISWVATDIAPVGHIEVGALQVHPVTADVWAVVAASTRLQHCKVTGFVTESLRLAGVSHVTIAVDEAADNVAVPPPASLPDGVELDDLVVAIEVAGEPPRPHPGGLYQWQIPGGAVVMGEEADSLRQALFAAIEANDADGFRHLVQARFADIVAAFDGWTTAPEAVRTDQEAASRYVRALVIIAETFDQAGEPALMRRLAGEDDSNPIVQWQRRLSHAQALSESGEYAASTAELEAVLAEMDTATGSAVATLRPKVLGRLGFNALHGREIARALDFTARAYDASVAAEDEEGRVAYHENRLSLEVIQALDRDPERGQRLLVLRRQIARAQSAADAGRYQASIATLEACRSGILAQDDELLRAHLPKVLGLLGQDEYRLGNAARARELTALALGEAKAVSDPEAIRIYAANLALIDEAGAPS